MKDPRQYKRRIQALTLTAALALPMVSLAESHMVVQGGKLNLRQQPSLEAAVLGQYPTGTWMTVHEETGKWSKVTVDGKSGYVMSKYLTEGNASGTLYVRTNTGAGLNLRSEPSESGKILTSCKPGTAVKLLSRGNGWHKVQVNGQVGYMAARYLTTAPATGNGSGSTGTTATFGTVQNPGKNQVLLLRETASTQARVLGYYRNGTQVTITGSQGDFYKVTVAGQNGYMMKKFISVKQEAFQPFTAVLVNPNGNKIVNFRKAPGLSAPIIKTLAVGTRITVTEMGDVWCKVTVDGTEGYVSRYFFEKSK